MGDFNYDDLAQGGGATSAGRHVDRILDTTLSEWVECCSTHISAADCAHSCIDRARVLLPTFSLGRRPHTAVRVRSERVLV